MQQSSRSNFELSLGTRVRNFGENKQIVVPYIASQGRCLTIQCLQNYSAMHYSVPIPPRGDRKLLEVTRRLSQEKAMHASNNISHQTFHIVELIILLRTAIFCDARRESAVKASDSRRYLLMNTHDAKKRVRPRYSKDSLVSKTQCRLSRDHYTAA